MLRPRWWRTSAAGVKKTPQPASRSAEAQVGVLLVEEEALVEAADGLERRAPGEEAGPGDPVAGSCSRAWRASA